MRNVFLVIQHEILTTLKKRSYWVMTFLFPALVLGLSVGSSALSERSFSATPDISSLARTVHSGYIDRAGIIIELPTGVSKRNFEAFPEEKAAQEALLAGKIDQYYLIPQDFLTSTEIILVVNEFSPLQNIQTNSLIEYVINFNLLGDLRLIKILQSPTSQLSAQRLAPAQPNSEASEVGAPPFMLPFVTVFIFFMLITLTGNLMLTSVTKEKENRTMEVLLLSLRPRELMFGKLIGLGAVGVLQMIIWFTGGYFALSQLSGGLSNAFLSLDSEMILWTVAFFLLGYLLYASLLGAIGALAPTAREGAQFSFIATFPLFFPIILNSIFAEAPNGSLATFFSLFPLTSPVAMVTRMTVIDLPAWQPVLSLLGLVITTYFIVLLSARAFQADALLSSTSLSLRRVMNTLLGKPGGNE